MRLWLVRHAQPEVAPGTCYGQLDIPAQALATEHCAQALASALPALARIMHSPLQRCALLAWQLQALRPDLAAVAPVADPRLQEMHFGEWEGQRWQAIDPAALQRWTDDFAMHCVGGHGESVTQVMDRVAAAFDEIGRAPSDITTDAVWITHAGVIRAVELIARGQRQITRADQWPAAAPDYGQWLTLTLQFP